MSDDNLPTLVISPDQDLAMRLALLFADQALDFLSLLIDMEQAGWSVRGCWNGQAGALAMPSEKLEKLNTLWWGYLGHLRMNGHHWYSSGHTLPMAQIILHRDGRVLFGIKSDGMLTANLRWKPLDISDHVLD